MPPRLKLSDVVCPICRDIYVEPIVLPCSHTICLSCLEKSYGINSSTCPVCRKRIATFLRQARNLKKLIDSKLWAVIRKQFPQEIARKCHGEDTSIVEEPAPTILAPSGSIKKEFDDMIEKLRCEEKKARLAEEEASKTLAQKLMDQEKKEAETRRKQHEQIVMSDKIYIQNLILSEQGNFSDAPQQSSIENNQNAPPLEEGCGRDSISDELHHFTPICIAPITPPKRLPDGKVGDLKIYKPVNLNKPIDQQKVLSVSSSIKNKTCLKVCSNNFARTHTLQEVTDMVPKPKEFRGSVAGRHQLENIRPHSSNIFPKEFLYNQEKFHAKLKQEQDDLALALKLHAKWNNNGRLPPKRSHSHYTLRSSKKCRVDR